IFIGGPSETNVVLEVNSGVVGTFAGF
ncbi:hypothetical protein A2U01_0073138, partial [Trifolium medium]|nr:hypothetical protein [Trifolium medium]